MIPFNPKKKYKNVFWFLLDGLRPDFLQIDPKGNFVEKLLSNATVFNHVVTTAAGTHTSMHSIFSSLLPSFNGATGWSIEALQNFNQNIFTIADFFQMAGYETFRYNDADGERGVPMSGFKRWESSGYKIGKVLFKTDLMKTARRDKFIEDVNNCKTNKFVYHHIELLHELNCDLGRMWKHEYYRRNIDITAQEFKKLYSEYIIGKDDLVILSSDHGVLLDKNYMQDGEDNGERHYEESVRAFFSLLGNDITSQILTKPISALDIAPTLLHVALDVSMNGQGHDQFLYMKNDIYQQTVFYREKGSWNVPSEKQNPFSSDVYYIRDGNWKYVFGEKDPRCEWLINLDESPDYKINLKDKYPELVKKYRENITKKFLEVQNFEYKSGLPFDKDCLNKMFSIILDEKLLQNSTIKSLLDLSGPYYEILICNSKQKPTFYDKYYKIKTIPTLDTDTIQSNCSGEWIIFIKNTGIWSEYFLSDLYRYIQCHRNKDVKIVSRNYLAVRKEDFSSTTKIELFEKKEVRTIVHCCPCPSLLSTKYILFGCGKMGQEALKYFGNDKVHFFVDNDPALVGKKFYGKEVLSFSELKKISYNYTIIISMGILLALEVKEQLESNDIYNYQLFQNMKNT